VTENEVYVVSLFTFEFIYNVPLFGLVLSSHVAKVFEKSTSPTSELSIYTLVTNATADELYLNIPVPGSLFKVSVVKLYLNPAVSP
jgi:hypothetical protein